jgi:hypothetical protein
LAFLTSCQKTAENPESIAPDQLKLSVTCSTNTPLIAAGGKYDENGTGYEIGKVTLNHDDPIELIYEITKPGWQFSSSHLYIGKECNIPKTSAGNPIPGQFPYKDPDDSTSTSLTYLIDYRCPDQYVVAAHAAVEYTELTASDFEDILPETAMLQIIWPYDYSYFQSIITEGGFLNGLYDGYCIDRYHGIGTSEVYPVDVYSSYEPLPAGEIGYPENLDLVNWLMNQDIIGTTSECNHTFIWQDIQNAIWELMDDGTSHSQPYNECEVNQLIALAIANGEGYEPGCGEDIAIVLVPETAQVSIIMFPIGPCGNLKETAWAYGTDGNSYYPGIPGLSFSDSPCYGGSRWGWYFYSCSWPHQQYPNFEY